MLLIATNPVDVMTQVATPGDFRAEIDAGVRRAADHIIAGKGATYHGIGGGVARIAQGIKADERAVLAVSIVTRQVGPVSDVALSLPRVIGHGVVVAELPPSLDEAEHAALTASAEIPKAAVESISIT